MKPGETFEMNGKRYRAAYGNGCNECAFDGLVDKCLSAPDCEVFIFIEVKNDLDNLIEKVETIINSTDPRIADREPKVKEFRENYLKELKQKRDANRL